MSDAKESDGIPSGSAPGGGAFPRTRWSLVAAAGSDRTVREQALERLCQDYWLPVYTFIRGQGRSVEDAKDLTQNLFLSLIEYDSLGKLSAENGRFRTFLLRCTKNLLAGDWRFRSAQKRGGRAEHLSIDTEEGEASLEGVAAKNGANPEVLYDRQWSARLLRRVMFSLAERYEAEGKGELFGQLWPLVAGGGERGRYGELASELGLSEPALRMLVFRMRKRYRTLLRDEIAHTVADPAEIDDEINHLMGLYQQDE